MTGQKEPRRTSLTCNRIVGFWEERRCNCPEDDDIHDPLTPFSHVYDPAPLCDEDELVSGTEPVEDDEGKTVGVRTWRGIRYLLRLDEPVSESQTVVALREVAGEALMRARLALTALEIAKVEAAPMDLCIDLTEPVEILAALCALLVEAGAVDPMEVD